MLRMHNDLPLLNAHHNHNLFQTHIEEKKIKIV